MSEKFVHTNNVTNTNFTAKWKFNISVKIKAGNIKIDPSSLLQDVNDEIPTFRSSSYVGEISENSPRATPILFLGGNSGNEEVLPEVFDHDSGTNGTFQLFLEGDQGIFDVCETSAFIFT